VLVDWLLQRPEIDGSRIGVTGTSFGSFFGTILTANEPVICRPVRHLHLFVEPGCPHRLFEEGSPTFKEAFHVDVELYDEQSVYELVKTMTWEGRREDPHP